MIIILNKILVSLFIWIQIRWIRKKYYKPFIKLTEFPETYQSNLLRNILYCNKDTSYGIEHNFKAIESYKDFQNLIPINNYENLRCYIDRQERTGKPHINSEQPVMYAQTSGTTGKAKNIPINKTIIQNCKRNQALLTFAQYNYNREIYSGDILAIVSPDIEGKLSTGTPYGSISGLIYKSLPGIIRRKYILPFEVLTVEDYNIKYYLICAFALISENITLIATPNPSTIFRLKDIIDNRFNELLKDMELGEFSCLDKIEDKKRLKIRKGFKRNPLRASQLRELKFLKNDLTISDIWPNLKLISTWTSGNCSTLMPALYLQLNQKNIIGEMGYMSTEFQGTINLDIKTDKQIPTLNDNFFEFVELELMEEKNPKYLLLHEVEIGKDYYIFVTTQNGLYRYFINDIVHVTGKYNNTPTIRFVQKGNGVVSLTGEKLYEDQINKAVLSLLKKNNLNVDFYIMVAFHKEFRYRLFIEKPFNPTYSRDLEDEIFGLNIEYKEKRKSGRLHPLEIVCVNNDIAEEFKQYNLKKGQREGQFKFIRLINDQNCDFNFFKFRI